MHKLFDFYRFYRAVLAVVFDAAYLFIGAHLYIILLALFKAFYRLARCGLLCYIDNTLVLCEFFGSARQYLIAAALLVGCPLYNGGLCLFRGGLFKLCLLRLYDKAYTLAARIVALAGNGDTVGNIVGRFPAAVAAGASPA